MQKQGLWSKVLLIGRQRGALMIDSSRTVAENTKSFQGLNVKTLLVIVLLKVPSVETCSAERWMKEKKTEKFDFIQQSVKTIIPT